MTEPSQSSEDAVLRSFAVYQDALVRIAELVRLADTGGSVAEPVRDICFRAHREVAAIFGPEHEHEPSTPVDPRAGASA